MARRTGFGDDAGQAGVDDRGGTAGLPDEQPGTAGRCQDGLPGHRGFALRDGSGAFQFVKGADDGAHVGG